MHTCRGYFRIFRMANFRPTLIERALQMARSGDFSKKEDVAKALEREGYEQARQHLDGRSVAALVRAAFREGQAAKEITNDSGPEDRTDRGAI